MNLGYDFTAEHEFGIQKIRDAFGVGKAAKTGIGSRQQTIVPSGLFFERRKDEAFLLYVPYDKYTSHPHAVNSSEYKKEILAWAERTGELSLFGEANFVSAWDEKSFAIRVKGDENISHLENLYNAFLNKRVVMGLVPASVWVGSGLAFCLDSAFSEEQRKQILAEDLSEEKLHKTVDKLGIKDRLQKAGRRYFALKPKWQDEQKTEILFWLNPQEQDKNNYGWVTLADLEEWIQGKGRIIKNEKPKQKRKARS